MIELLADALKNPVVLNIYLAVAFAIMVLPMIALTLWYHGTVNKTEGGRALMREQNKHNTGGRTLSGTARDLKGAGNMARGIASGAYGGEVKQLQNRTYLYVLGWVAANIIVFGVLIWAQDFDQRRNAATAAPASATQPAR